MGKVMMWVAIILLWLAGFAFAGVGIYVGYQGHALLACDIGFVLIYYSVAVVFMTGRAIKHT